MNPCSVCKRRLLFFLSFTRVFSLSTGGGDQRRIWNIPDMSRDDCSRDTLVGKTLSITKAGHAFSLSFYLSFSPRHLMRLMTVSSFLLLFSCSFLFLRPELRTRSRRQPIAVRHFCNTVRGGGVCRWGLRASSIPGASLPGATQGANHAAISRSDVGAERPEPKSLCLEPMRVRQRDHLW